MKQKIKKEQEARGARRSRGSNTKKSGGKNNFSSDLATGFEWGLGIAAAAALVAAAVVLFPVEVVAAVGTAIVGGIVSVFSFAF